MNKKTMLQRIFSLFLVAILMLGVSACDNAKKDEGKKEEVKKEEPKKEVSKKEVSKKDEPKKDEPKKDEPKKDEPKKEVSKKWNVMATSTMLTDLAKVIGGEKANVTGLMEAGVDPHLYQPSAGDITKLEGSDMIVINGLHLEGQMGKVFKGLTAKNKLVAEVGESVPKEARLPFDESEFDPHIWFSVANWKIAARNVTDTYITLSPADKDYFNQNYEAYVKELDELDKYIRTEVEKVAKPARVLITAHDAFNYFGKEYGFEVMGLQGISTESEASTSDVSELANFIAKNKIKAIFVESSVPRKNVEALQEAVKAKGFNVEIGGELFSDSLGEGKASTYIGMFKENVDIIVGALKE